MERSRSFLLHQVRAQNVNMFSFVVALGGILTVFLFAYAAFGSVSKDNTTLKLISIIFRHGDKNPTSTYPNDPYGELTFWPEGWGQLTIKGKKQIFQLGETLLVRYGSFLGAYSAQTVRVDSSDHERCLQSAAIMLAALFPPKAEQVWNENLLWQPIPVHTAPLALDKLITVSAPCPRFVEEKTRVDAELSSMYDKNNTELYQYLSEKTGQNITTLLAVETLYNILEIEEDSGKTLPNWTASVYPDKMKDIAALVLSSFSYTPVMKLIKGGPLVKAITTNMNLCSEGKSSKKLSLYAAHDMTIVQVRRALGFNDLTFKPELGSALIVELHVVNSNPEVKLLYLDSYKVSKPVQWEIPGCPSPCSLSTFTGAVSSVIPKDWDAECEANHSKDISRS